jgi:hypothetical protein
MNKKLRKPGSSGWITSLVTLGAALAGTWVFAQTPPPASTNVPPAQFDTNSEPRVVQPAQINLSRELAELVRLAQSGADESVVLAYIEKVPAYKISGDEIIYLQDLGVSDTVIKALVIHSSTAPNIPTTTNAPIPAVPESQPVTPVGAPPAMVTEFYEPLTPYGTWIEVAPYGWCWQPSVVVINSGWHPYCDNGYWLWSDSGWYWHSYYSWGWAPFHYGRWFYHPYRRWVWLPDRVWGPSWVSWRSGPDYCGWAPLPPGAHFSVGVGWTFGGRAVGPDFSFGLAATHFTFVASSHFADRHLAARSLPRQQVNVVYNNTTVINNYVAGPNQRIINRGVDRSRIEAATKTRIPEVAVRELPHEPQRVTMPDRMTKVGKADVVYRPGPKIEVPRKPIPAAMGQRIAPPISKQGSQPEPQQRGQDLTPSKAGRSEVTPVPVQPHAIPSQPSVPMPVQPKVTPASPARQRVAPPNSLPPVKVKPQIPKSPPKQEEPREKP